MPNGITLDDKCGCQNAILSNSRIECSIELHTTATIYTTVIVCPSSYLGLGQG